VIRPFTTVFVICLRIRNQVTSHHKGVVARTKLDLQDLHSFGLDETINRCIGVRNSHFHTKTGNNSHLDRIFKALTFLKECTTSADSIFRITAVIHNHSVVTSVSDDDQWSEAETVVTVWCKSGLNVAERSVANNDGVVILATLDPYRHGFGGGFHVDLISTLIPKHTNDQLIGECFRVVGR